MGLALVAAAVAFLGVLLVVVGFYQARGSESAARRRLRTLERYSAPQSDGSIPLALRDRGSAWAERTRSELDRAGLALKLHEYVSMRVLVGLLAFAVVLLLGGATTVAVLLAMTRGFSKPTAMRFMR